MWIKNTSTRTQGKNYALQHDYLIVNTSDGNPAIRISEKARLTLGWDETDFVNVYCDDEKIMIIRDNDRKEFPVRLYKSAQKNLGCNIYSKALKEHINAMEWEGKEYSIDFRKDGKELMLVCYKTDLQSDIEKALRIRRKSV